MERAEQTPVRCTRCRLRLFDRSPALSGQVEIKCPRCGCRQALCFAPKAENRETSALG